MIEEGVDDEWIKVEEVTATLEAIQFEEEQIDLDVATNILINAEPATEEEQSNPIAVTAASRFNCFYHFSISLIFSYFYL